MIACIWLVSNAHHCVRGRSNIVATASKPVGAFTFYDAQNRQHTLAELPGKLKIVHFWATWCQPCVSELPAVDATQKAYKDKGLNIIAISLDGADMGTVQDFLTNHRLSGLTPYIDSDNTVTAGTGIHGLPTSLFINENGKEIARAQGMVDWNSPDVKAFIEEQLQAP